MVVERMGIVGGGVAEVGGIAAMRLLELGEFGSTISTDVLDEGGGASLMSLRTTSPVPEHAVMVTTMTRPRIENDFRRQELGRRSSSAVPRVRGTPFDRHEGTRTEGSTSIRCGANRPTPA